MKEKISKIVLFFFIFVSIFSIISLAVGYFWLNSYFLISISILISFLIIKKFGFSEKTRFEIILLFFGMALLIAYPLLLLHPFFDASSDAATVINLRILKDKIPKTYEPYSKVSYSYQSALSILVKSVSDFLPFIKDYLIYWFFGVLIGALQVFTVYYFAKRFFKNEKIGLYAALLLFGTKLIFLNAYFGDHALTLGISIMLLTILTFHENSKLKFLFYPALIIVHPAAAMLFFIAITAYLITFKQKFKEFLKLLPFTALAIPSIITTYSPLIEQIFLEKSNSLASFNDLLSQTFLIPLSIGLPVIFLFSFLAILFFTKKNQKISKELFFCIFTFILTVIIYFVSSINLVPFTGKFFELMTIAGILCTGFFIEKLINVKKNKENFLIVGIFVLCIFGFFSSGQLNDLRNGTKMNSKEFEFAEKFFNFEPRLEKSLFLVSRPSKIAEYSNKIPFDVLSDYFLAANVKQVKNDKALAKALADQNFVKKILKEKCVQCINQVEVKFVVIEKSIFPELSLEKILEFGDFVVYKK